MQFLKKGLFEKDFMQTRIKSNHMPRSFAITAEIYDPEI